MGVAMPKKFATRHRRQESASDGCKIVRFVSRFCSNYPGLPIADASQMICNWAITFSWLGIAEVTHPLNGSVMTGQKTLLKRKDARRCRLQSPPMQSEAIGGSSHDLLTKPGLNPLKTLRQCDCSTYIRIIARIVQRFFIFYVDPQPKPFPTVRRHCDWAIRCERSRIQFPAPARVFMFHFSCFDVVVFLLFWPKHI